MSKLRNISKNEELADKLLAKLRYELPYPSGAKGFENSKSPALIWNLFYGKHEFSSEMFNIILRKITEPEDKYAEIRSILKQRKCHKKAKKVLKKFGKSK